MADKSIHAKIEAIIAGDEKVTEFRATKTVIFPEQYEQLVEGLCNSTVVEGVYLDNMEMDTPTGELFAKVISTNTSIKFLDLGYNKIGPEGIQALCVALRDNKSIEEVKIHRQEKDYGHSVETEIVKLWETNTTLTRLYATIHDRACNSANTRGEVRNKEIKKRIAAGKDWLELDPLRKDEWMAVSRERRETRIAEEQKANAPITEKIPSTGGPYTYKQLSAPRAFWPDDVELKKRETYLSDTDFQEVFKCSKEEFEKLPGWKKVAKKKEVGLN
jgi:hypothetical protein